MILTTPRLAFILAAVAACGAPEGAEVGESGPAGAAAYGDPCSLLTRAEAEAVLGKLVADPRRTREGTAQADPAGPSCAYVTAGDRALILTPEWTYGKVSLNAERMIGGLVRQVADLPGVVADTLEGQWDEAVVGMTGELLLLKGSRSLTIAYLESSTDAAGAIRLSGPALTRLAAVPAPPRPEGSADGCPLSVEAVSEILAEPVRMAPSPVKRIDACSYVLESDPTVEVELAIHPAAIADGVFDGMHARAGAAGGAGARADTLELGQGGNAFGSSSMGEAAARVGDEVYHAKVIFPLGGARDGLKEAMVRMVTSMMKR